MRSLDRVVFRKGRGSYIKKGTIKTFQDNGHGYLNTMLTLDGKQKRAYIHRLVAMTFVPNPKNKKEVNHINGNKLDNRAVNLEWVSPKENILHAKDKLGRWKDQAKRQNMPVICVELKIKFPSLKAAAEFFGDFRGKGGGISAAIKAKTRAKGYHWKKI